MTLNKNAIKKNKRQKEKQLKTLNKYSKGKYGPDDGKVKLPKARNILIDGVLKEELEEEFTKNENIPINVKKNGKIKNENSTND